MGVNDTYSGYSSRSLLRQLSSLCVYLFCSIICVTFIAGPLGATSVTVQGRKILVNGQVFTIKGVCFSPVPAGSDWQYAWGANARIYEPDLAYIKAMGGNTVRTYQERNITQEFLDAAYAHGIYVIVGWGENLWSKDFSNAATRATAVTAFRDFVNTWKGHPAVLMWCFGNETEEHTVSRPGWYTLVQEAAAAAHAADPDHLVTTANQETTEIGSAALNTTDAVLSALDVWGVNVYRGRSFGSDFFPSISGATAKPYFVSEWGCDAYNGVQEKEDKSLQDVYLYSQWSEISSNLAADGKDCSGGTLFEWVDEWWKGASNPANPATLGSGGIQGSSAQDIATDWTSNAYVDDPNMNEEWWGIISTDAEGRRTPRLAYYTLRSLWSPGGASAAAPAANIFQSEVRNFPNPFVPGTTPTRIEFTVSGNPAVEVAIYDLEGRKVSGVEIAYRYDSGLVAAEWGGRDENNSTVAAGLYIARVKAKTASKEETRYRKIAVVK